MNLRQQTSEPWTSVAKKSLTLTPYPLSPRTRVGVSLCRQPLLVVGVVHDLLRACDALEAPLHVVEVDLRDRVLDHRPDGPPDGRERLVEHEPAEVLLVHLATVGR